LNGRIEAEDYEHRQSAWHAWHVAGFMRQKYLPNLKVLMTKLGAEVAKQQTPEEMLKVAEYVTKALGGKDLRDKKKE